MGYYIRMEDACWRLPFSKLKDAYDAMIALDQTHDHLKRGGSYGSEGRTEKWFSWMPADYATSMETVGEILQALGFELETNDAGDIVVCNYDNKTGQEELFLSAVAPFVLKDSYINWSGEEGSKWQLFFDGEKMITKNGITTYTNNNEEE